MWRSIRTVGLNPTIRRWPAAIKNTWARARTHTNWSGFTPWQWLRLLQRCCARARRKTDKLMLYTFSVQLPYPNGYFVWSSTPRLRLQDLAIRKSYLNRRRRFSCENTASIVRILVKLYILNTALFICSPLIEASYLTFKESYKAALGAT